MDTVQPNKTVLNTPKVKIVKYQAYIVSCCCKSAIHNNERMHLG